MRQTERILNVRVNDAPIRPVQTDAGQAEFFEAYFQFFSQINWFFFQAALPMAARIDPTELTTIRQHHYSVR